ncbi:MAG: hypothetical protein QM750_08055 [Rubrivivax sp.]
MMSCRCAIARRLAPWFTALTTLLSIVAAGVLATAPSQTAAQALPELPPRLSQTGLFAAGEPGRIAPGLHSFTPQYPLWSDGAAKRRWIALPPGTAIDAGDPDAWQFPPGTRLWKEFAVDGRPVETRYIERRADGQWRFGSYVWQPDGRDAVLAPPRGQVLELAAPPRGQVLPLAAAPGGRYEVPGRGDCLACHDGAAVPVLGFGALQLSPDRDPLAPHAEPLRPADLDLPALAAQGLLRGLPAALLAQPPRIAAADARERAALGYLHGNCAHCHNDDGSPAPVGLRLAQSVADAAGSLRRVRDSLIGAASRYRPADAGADGGDWLVVQPGRPSHSVLTLRLRSRQPQAQMPPLGTRIADEAALALVERWIAGLRPAAASTQALSSFSPPLTGAVR